MSARDPWSEFEEVTPQQAPRAGGGVSLRPVLSLPDPQQDRDNRIEDTNITRQNEQDRLSRIDVYRKEFLGSDDVKNFREVAGATRQIAALAKSETDTPGPRDIALIISYMKALDPGSVVREGEFATAENAGGVPAKIRNLYNSTIKGGKLTPEVRREFARTAIGVYDTRRSAYNEFTETYRGLIQDFGEDPDRHGIRLAEPIEFGEQGEGFVPNAGEGQRASGLLDPEMRSGVPKGTEVELGIDKWLRDDITPGRNYLESIGIYPNDEARITAFWNTNASNPDLNVENVKQWYAANDYPAPTDDQIAATIAEARKGVPFSGIDTSDIEEEYYQMLDEAIEQRGSDPSSIAETAAVGAASGGTLYLNDEVSGIAGALAAIAQGNDPHGAYQAERDIVRRFRDRSFEENPGTAITSELAGGLLTGGSSVGRSAVQGGRRAAAREGAKVGFVSGYGSGEGTSGSVQQAALGIPIGVAAGVAGDKIASTLSQRLTARRANRGAQPPSEGRQVIEAADRFNEATGAKVQPIPADVGGATTRRMTGGAAQTTFGARPIVEAAENVNTQAQAGIRTIAAREGAVPKTPQSGGEVAIRGADKAMKRAKTRVDAKYATARREAGDARVPLPFAQQVAAREIAELSDTPGGVDAAKQLRDVVGDLDGNWTVDGIKRFRKLVRDKLVKDGLRGSEVESAALRIVEAADNDIEDGLVSLGKEAAARAYADASKAASERFTLIDDVLAPIIGKKGEKSGEQVFRAIDRMSRGDAVALGKFMKALPEEEAGSIRAIVIDRLGRASKGRQDADGQAFSLNDFLTRWNDEGLSPEAKSVLFGGETRAALDDLARVAQGSKEAQRFANNSNTAGANLFNALINGTPIGAAFYDPVTAVVAGGGAVAAQYITGRLLASPAYARWLAKMPKQKTEAAVRAHVNRLDRVAAADTAIAGEALGLQKTILDQLASGPQKVAADQTPRDADSNTTGPETR